MDRISRIKKGREKPSVSIAFTFHPALHAYPDNLCPSLLDSALGFREYKVRVKENSD
jgi:hypothetical protein